jgi:hypothetical protein
MVLTQLKTLTAVGIATIKVITEKYIAEVSDIPATNIWWAQTKNPATAIAIDERYTAR